IILAGALSSLFVFVFNRLVWQYMRTKSWSLNQSIFKNSLIIGNEAEFKRVKDLLNNTAAPCKIIGFVSEEAIDKKDNLFLGNMKEVEEIVQIFNIDEIIFCSKDIDATEIMRIMSVLQNKNIDFKMVPEDSLYIIGSSSKDQAGDYYSINVSMDILNPKNKMIKRFFDILIAVLLFVFGPICIWFVDAKKHFYTNIFIVLSGKYSWVGYSDYDKQNELPKIKLGILNTTSGIEYNKNNGQTSYKLNLLYAKDYSIEKDIYIILKGFSGLGKSIR
ncbi:MAG: hypothetical protein HYZ42_06965, partial [Bacteroidetes bacterium]|nr:hypothetical protein [Bacteroidota bacterium]